MLSPGWYWVPGLASLVALIGLGRTWLAERYHYLVWQVRYAWLALGSVLLAWTITILRSQAALDGVTGSYLSHGRYALVAIAPFAILFSAGIVRWFPITWRRWGVGAYVLGFVAFEWLCFWGTLMPYYYR